MKKKLAVFLLALVAACPALMAQKNLTAEQQQVQSSIRSFLRSEGYAPYTDTSDNSIEFKKEGDRYWVYVYESGPYYIRLQRAGYTLEEGDYASALIAANEATRTVKAVKVAVSDTSVSFYVDSFVSSAMEFRKIFSRALSALDAGQTTFDEEYEKISD